MTNPTSRSDFHNTWLIEMPSSLGSFKTYDALVYNIKDLLKNNIEKRQISKNFFNIRRYRELSELLLKD